MLAETSLIAFEKMKEDLGYRQFQVFNGFKKLEFATNAMVAKEINLPINCITGRCLELRKKELLERSHVSNCPVTRGKAQFWKLKLNLQEEKQWNRTIHGQDSAANI